MTSLKTLIQKVTNAIKQGEFNQIQTANGGPTPPKEIKRLKNIAAKCDVNAASGNNAKAVDFAHWLGIVHADARESEYFYGVLVLDRWGSRTLYAVPLEQVGRVTALPGCPLGADEVRQRMDLAEKLSEGWKNQVVHFGVIAKTAQKQSHIMHYLNSHTSYDERELIQLFKKTPEMSLAFIAALDNQLRTLLHSYTTPVTAYNFVATDGTTSQWLESWLQAVSFEDATLKTPGEMVRLTIRSKEDFEDYIGQGERSALLRIEGGVVAEELVKALDGDLRGKVFKTLPLMISDSVLDSANVVNIWLPANLEPLSDEDIVVLRAAMARCLTDEFCDYMHSVWLQEIRSLRAGYWTPAEQWRQMLTYMSTGILCPSEEMSEALDKVFEEKQDVLWKVEDDLV